MTVISDEINSFKNEDWNHTHMYLPYQLIRLWVIAEYVPHVLLRELEEEHE